MVTEIETIAREQIEAAATPGVTNASSPATHQFAFTLDDPRVLRDIEQLCGACMLRTNWIQPGEQPKITHFLSTFMRQFLHQTNLDAAAAAKQAAVAEAVEQKKKQGSSPDLGAAAATSSPGQAPVTDAVNAADVQPALSEAVQEAQYHKELRNQERASHTDKATPASPAAPVDAFHTTLPRQKNTMYSNTHFFTVFRTLEIIYSRLHALRVMADGMMANPYQHPAIRNKEDAISQRLEVASTRVVARTIISFSLFPHQRD